MKMPRDAGVAARTSGQAWPIGRPEPARLLVAAQRLIVLIEGSPLSCKGTNPQRAIQARSNVVAHQTTPKPSAGLAGAVPLPLAPNASHTQVINISTR